MSSASLPQPGDLIAGKYVVERKLGEGGMGAVYAARNTRVNKVYALKVMLPDATSEEARKRFENEALNAGSLTSDNIAQVIDSGFEGGLNYMVIELLEGKDLAQISEEIHRAGHKIEPHVAVGWVLQALEGVRVAHASKIIHRDLKPSNLFLAKKPDGSEIVKVLDFGISKSQGDSPFGQAVSALTSTKAMLGSPLYVAPEQVRSSKGVDARTDIWAVGVILYELLTGVPPFMGDHLGELFAQIIEEAPTPVSVRSPSVPPQLDAIVLKCLEKRPDNRFQSAQELMNALRPFTQPIFMGTVAMSGASPFAASAGPAPPGMVQTPSGPMPLPPGFNQTPPGPGGLAVPGGMPGGSITGGGAPVMAPGMAMVGATTGSGVHPPVVKGPLGAITPQPGQWQSTTGGVVGRSSNVIASVAIVGVAALLVVGGAGLYYRRTAGAGPATGANPPPPASSTLPLPEPPSATAAVASSAPVESTSVASTASAPPVTPAHVTNVKPGVKPTPVPPVKPTPSVAKPEPKPEPPPVVVKPPAPPPTQKPSDPRLQENR